MVSVFSIFNIRKDDQTKDSEAVIRKSLEEMKTSVTPIIGKIREAKARGHAELAEAITAALNMQVVRDTIKMNVKIGAILPERLHTRYRGMVGKQVAELYQARAYDLGLNTKIMTVEGLFRTGFIERQWGVMDRLIGAGTEEIHTLKSGIDRADEVLTKIHNKAVPNMDSITVHVLLNGVEASRLLERGGHIEKYEHPTGR